MGCINAGNLVSGGDGRRVALVRGNSAVSDLQETMTIDFNEQISVACSIV